MQEQDPAFAGLTPGKPSRDGIAGWHGEANVACRKVRWRLADRARGRSAKQFTGAEEQNGHAN
jgi:hypothetical protein